MNDRSPARRLLIIFNPTAGWRRRPFFDAVVDRLRAAGCALSLRETTCHADARRLAAAADPARCDVLVVAGGDGTINEVINGLDRTSPPLALIPLGTANVLAAEIGLALDPQAVADTIICGIPRSVSLGLANGHRFVLMAGAGFDAHVVRSVDLPLKRLVGKAAYVLAICRQLLAFRFPLYRVRIDGAECEVASVVVANAHFYGGRYVCAPQASLFAPELQVCLFEHGGRLRTIGYALALFSGILPRLSSYRIVPARSVEIHGPSGDPVQGDGDIIGELDVAISILPDALNLVLPPTAA